MRGRLGQIELVDQLRGLDWLASLPYVRVRVPVSVQRLLPRAVTAGESFSATAQAIDTPRSNLYKKLEQYGITQENDG